MRLISAEQVKLFKQSLEEDARVQLSQRLSSDELSIDIWVVPNNNEAFAFAPQVRSMLVDAGWRANIIPGTADPTTRFGGSEAER